MKNKDNKRLKGFTLAEVLITLSIIGVVAAMTIPTLMGNQQKQQYVTGLKKAYAVLSNAMQMLPLERGCSSGDYDCTGMWSGETTVDDKTFTTNFQADAYLLTKVLKTTTFCVDEDTKCSTNNSHEIFKNNNIYAKLILADGMGIATDGREIYVDVNGVGKGPNKLGRDIFYFLLVSETRDSIQTGRLIPHSSRLYAQYTSNDYENEYWRNNNKCTTEVVNSATGTPEACTGRVLEEDKMNY